MLRTSRGEFVLMLTISAALLLASALAAQEAAPAERPVPAKTSLDRVSGTIARVDRDQSVIDVRKGTLIRKVSFGSATQITTMNEPKGSVADLKEGTRVICVGRFDKPSAKLLALRIEIRQ